MYEAVKDDIITTLSYNIPSIFIQMVPKVVTYSYMEEPLFFDVFNNLFKCLGLIRNYHLNIILSKRIHNLSSKSFRQ